jgi:hypothetical protein
MHQSGYHRGICQRTLCHHCYRTMYALFPSHGHSTTTHIIASIVETSEILGITGCYQGEGSFKLFIPFLLLFVHELGVAASIHICTGSLTLLSGLLSLTLIRATQSWRTVRNALYAVLLKHDVFYYACGLCESASHMPAIFLYSSMKYSCPESLLGGKHPHIAAPQSLCTPPPHE